MLHTSEIQLDPLLWSYPSLLVFPEEFSDIWWPEDHQQRQLWFCRYHKNNIKSTFYSDPKGPGGKGNGCSNLPCIWGSQEISPVLSSKNWPPCSRALAAMCSGCQSLKPFSCRLCGLSLTPNPCVKLCFLRKLWLVTYVVMISVLWTPFSQLTGKVWVSQPGISS